MSILLKVPSALIACLLFFGSSTALAKSKICKKGESAIKLDSAGFIQAKFKPTKDQQKKLWSAVVRRWKADTSSLSKHCKDHESGQFFRGKALFKPLAYRADSKAWQLEVYSKNYCCAELDEQETEEQALLHQIYDDLQAH